MLSLPCLKRKVGAEILMEDILTTRLADGRTVSYAEYGDPEGVPLIYFHGWPSSRIQGKICHEGALEHGWRVFCMDRPGIGKTTPQENRTLAEWPAMFTGFIDALGLSKVAIFGVSGGAPYVYATAHSCADRVTVAGVGSGAAPIVESERSSEMLLPYRILLFFRHRAPKLVERLVAKSGHAAGWKRNHPLWRIAYRLIPAQDRCAIGTDLIHECVMGSFRAAMVNGPRPVVEDGDIYSQQWPFKLEDIGFPIYLWHGELDNNIPASMAREVATRLPKCEAHFLEEDGHYSLSANRTPEILGILKEKAEAIS